MTRVIDLDIKLYVSDDETLIEEDGVMTKIVVGLDDEGDLFLQLVNSSGKTAYILNDNMALQLADAIKDKIGKKSVDL